MPATLEHLEANLNRGQRAHWWRRRGTARTGFQYVDEQGRPVTASKRQRIRQLAIPPAWTHVRISPSPGSRLQALGVDGSGRLQYLYHPRFRKKQDRRKFERIERFGDQLPRIRKITSQHIGQPGLGRDKVFALVVRLLDSLHFRPGSEEGVEKYHTFGLTTLRKRHLRVEADGNVSFRFDGKHHVRHQRVLMDPRLCALLSELRDLKGPHLFQYVQPDGTIHPVRGRELNDYVKQLAGPDFSAKDFRTWHATLLVAQELAKLGPAPSPRQRRQNLACAVRRAAETLGNTPAVCRRSYLHPLIVRLYERGITLVDVPLDPRRLRAVQTEPVVEEMQLLELFHVGRVLEQESRSRRVRVAQPKSSGALGVAAPAFTAQPSSS